MNRSESKYFHTAARMDEALLSLLLEKDFAYITVKDVCVRAGVNRSTFYLHYENTADLLAEAVDMVNRRYQSRFPGPGFADAAIIAQPKESLFFMTDRWLLPWYEQVFRAVFSPVLSRYGVAVEQHAYMMAFYRHGLVAILLQWVEADCRESPAEIAEIIKRCVGHAANETT